MEEKQIRTPQQRRSIEKKNKIIQAGLQLFAQKGFYKTNTAEIAKAAGVSTGIVYSYFENKNDILLAGISLRGEQMLSVINDTFMKLLDSLEPTNHCSTDELEPFIRDMLHYCVKMHEEFGREHTELQSLIYEKEVCELLLSFEQATADLMSDLLKKAGFSIENPVEKIHIIYNLIEDYCHEAVFHKHNNLNYELLYEYTVQTIMFILK